MQAQINKSSKGKSEDEKEIESNYEYDFDTEEEEIEDEISDDDEDESNAEFDEEIEEIRTSKDVGNLDPSRNKPQGPWLQPQAATSGARQEDCGSSHRR